MNAGKEVYTRKYNLVGGTIIAHWIKFPEGTILKHYTVLKNGIESKKYYRIGNAYNFMNKEILNKVNS